ncbi:hypothetical protein BDW74DRAFT_181132 [Aspergillus multicolor]|uniref:uncharacterized protein n=1 Tax=Aspergillus multicolor TaxID=41759 RepID=UPI003CCD3BC8
MVVNWPAQAGVPGLRMLLVIFSVFSLALSFPFHLEHLERQLNSSAEVSRLADSAIYTYSRITYGESCSDDQQLYIEQELDEMIKLLQVTTQNIGNLQFYLEHTVQPENWGANYDYISKLLATWQAYMGVIQLTDETQPYPWGQHVYSFTEAIDKMDDLIGIYNIILDELNNGGPDISIDCNDEHYVRRQPREGEDPNLRYYTDTRPEGQSSGTYTLGATGGLCHESQGGTNGWSVRNRVTGRDEVCICPAAFERARTSQMLQDLSNDANTLKGVSINTLKLRTIVGTLLHEFTHVQGILGTPTRDLVFNIPAGPNGRWPAKSEPSYRGEGCRALAGAQPHLTLQNADSLAYFAVASWYDACDWSSNFCGQAKDNLKTEDGFVTFDFN